MSYSKINQDFEFFLKLKKRMQLKIKAPFTR